MAGSADLGNLPDYEGNPTRIHRGAQGSGILKAESSDDLMQVSPNLARSLYMSTDVKKCWDIAGM